MDLTTGGTHALLVTPFDTDGALDFRSLASLIDFVIDGGVQGVVALGTTGEFFTLTPAERVEVMRRVVEITAGRVPVTIGVGADSTATCVELAQHARTAGADCAMVLPPLYFDQSDTAQIAHFTTVARAVDLPVMIYDGSGNIPVPASVIAAVAANASNVRYAKLALPDPARIQAVTDAAPQLIPLAGDDTTLPAALRAGAQGSAIATGNIQPGPVSRLHEAYGKGETDRVAEIFATALAPSIMATSTPKSEFIARFKEVLAAMGVITSPAVRAPLHPVDPADREELLAVMRVLGVL